MTGKEAKAEYMRKYRETHKEEIKQYMRKWQQDNKDKVKANNNRYWERKSKIMETKGEQ